MENRLPISVQLPHPLGVRKDQIESPLPGFAQGAQKVIQTAISNNDLEFFYKMYLAKLAELSLTGKGKEFYEHAMSSIDDSPVGIFMAKGFEAIGNLIDMEFEKCSLILDELGKQTNKLDIYPWVEQITNLCRAYISFNSGDFSSTLKFADNAINSPVKSGSLDPLDQGRLIRLKSTVGLITSDLNLIERCAEDISRVANPDDLVDLTYVKSAVESMHLLAQGRFIEAYEKAKTVVVVEDNAGRVGISAPFDCRFVMIRCLYEFSQIPEVLTQLEILKANALKNKSLIIFWLCEVGEIRILCRDLNNFVEVSKRIDSFRSKVASDPALKNLTWLLDIAEIFLKGATNESLRLDQLFDRNSEIPYVKFLSKSKSKDSNEKLYEELKRSPENTPFQVIYKNLYLSKFRVEGLKKHRAYLNTAINLGEKVGAREIFLRQDIKTLEAIIDLAKDSKSHWLESLGRDCLDRIKEKNSLLQFDGEHLTQREIEVLRYLSTDYSVEKIGKSLHISKNTMKTHLKNIYRKLKVDNRKQATAIAKTKLLI